MNITPIEELKNTFKIDELCKSSLVLMDVKQYSKLMEQLEEARHLLENIEEKTENRLHDVHEVLEDLVATYDLAL